MPQPTYLTLMLEAYIECALWSTTDNSNEQGGDPLDDNYDETDLDPDTYAEMLEDCASFLNNASELLEMAPYILRTPYTAEQAGHDFWLTRNGHGAGFWDRGLGDIGDRLSDIARTYGSYDLYVTDDGKVAGN